MSTTAHLSLAASAALFLGSLARAQTPIQYGQTMLGSFCNSSTATFQFEGRLGDVLYASASELGDFGGSCSSACCCQDMLVTITDPNGVVTRVNTSGIQGNSCGNLTRVPLGPEPLLVDGTYTVQIGDANGFGGGSFALFVENLTDPQGAVSVGSPSNTLANVQLGGSVQSFLFTGTPSSVLSVELQPLTGSLVVPRAELYHAGTLVDLPATGTFETPLVAGGEYLLLTYSRVQELGAYTVDLDVHPAPIAIWPESGVVPAGATFDLSITLTNPGSPVTGGSFVFDGANVTAFLLACPRSGSLASRLVLTCPDVSASTLGEGVHTLAANLNFADGSHSSHVVRWVVVP